MVIKIADGSIVEVVVGLAKVMLVSDAFGVGLGPFLVVGQEGDLPLIQLVAGPTPEESKVAPVSPELIASVDNPDEEKVEVKLPSGQVIKVDASVALILQAIIDTNTQLMDQLAKVLSGEEIANLKKELEASLAINAELQGVIKELESKLEKVRGALPALDSAMVALQEVQALLKA
jgi:hypothetical protein